MSDTPAANGKAEAPSTQKLDWKQQKETQALLRKKENDLKKCEEKIETLETKNAALDDEMAKPEIATNSAKLQEIAKKRRSKPRLRRSTPSGRSCRKANFLIIERYGSS